MIYQLSLQTTGIVAGLLLIVGHLIALLRPGAVMGFLKDFPRSRPAGTALILVAAIWSFLLVRSIDLGEFTGLRTVMLVAIPVGAVLAWIYVPEFLAVRALGMVLLLAAEPLLESAVLREEPTRLLIVLLGYAWAGAGLFLVGMPYLLRDAIQWVTSAPLRWKAACVAGFGWGIAVLAAAVFLW